MLLGALASCRSLTPQTPDAGAFDVAIFGDMPYITGAENAVAKTASYQRVLADIERSPLAFAVHIGDLAGPNQCSDSVYTARRRDLDALAHPSIYLFGDNEWTDCTSPYDPAERLAQLRRTFARPHEGSFGPRAFAVQRQAGNPENLRWIRGGVYFVGLHVVGSNNNWGPDSSASAEHRARDAANIVWLRETFEQATAAGAIGVAVFMHANPLPSAAARAARPNGFGSLMTEFRRAALAFGRPVALVHGDTHYFRVDKPFSDAATFAVHAHITRAETFGDPNNHWLRMTVDPRDPAVFSFRAMIVAGNE